MDGIPIRYPGAGGCSCTGFIRVKENEPAGQFYGPVFQGIDDDGKWILSNEMDHQKIGNGLPTSFLGWSHSVHFRNLKVDLLVRGIFGHDLISVTRMLYENRNIGTHNILKSTPKNLDDFNTWSSDYLKLDNLTFSYHFPQNRNRILKEARIFVSVDNLLTITKYSGVDPSARLTNQSSFSQYNVMGPGIDPPSTWLDSRTFMAGLDLYF
ncbi:hypothetical protein LQ318_09490 [Aliifodinibius salicampi]|uniref:TonB dependent receptor n=1 Tax=Fodinibius salicampi TaxID=1920655 RepID=A0ABT3PZ80_9BACT|nr:hypothetical protein [Fodinibius salicampi]MCW9713136.1 hypothetical protein [Fodinibius salicampi]